MLTLTERQIRAITNVVRSETEGQDWRWPVGGGSEPLTREEMLDLRERLLRYLQKPLPEHGVEVKSAG